MAIDSYGVGALLVFLLAAVSVGGLILMRRTVSADIILESHEVSGYLLSVVGTMYAVLLGLVVVDAMAKFQDARNNVQTEANCLADIFILSERYPADKERDIKALCNFYARRVIEVEWDAMDSGGYDPDARRTAIQLMRAVQNFEPATQGQQQIYPIAVQEVCQLWDCRRKRVNSAQTGVPIEEWIVLLAGGVLTITFTYFFSLKHIALQVAMTAMCSVILSLNLLLVLWFGYPFSGDRKVHPDAFVGDVKIFENELEKLSNAKMKDGETASNSALSKPLETSR